MAVGAGKFQLYSKIDPHLSAGDYRFVADQSVEIDGVAATDADIATHHSHVRVRSPRYQMPPDQILSTFPPAGSQGSYGTRLPQVVIKRRTLPWERDLEGQPSSTPWMALVLIAEGEGSLSQNQPVEACVTPPLELQGVRDTKLGTFLSVRKSVVDRVFPTQKDVHLLAHAREVDINDTELMMGDDDGFLSVVISNRLPLPGRGEDGSDAPVKYLACLVNLEGQFERLLPQSPPRRVFTVRPIVAELVPVTVSAQDQQENNTVVPTFVADAGGTVLPTVPLAATDVNTVRRASVATTGTPPFSGEGGWSLEDAEVSASTVYAEMAADFNVANVATIDPLVAERFDPELRFPVLMHWSFVSSGATTFQTLMENLDSGLMGTRPKKETGQEGRPPLEVVQTGHVGLTHRTRRGDTVRSWYRGPLMAHPATGPGDRLPLAHVADQLRIVVPDGREDLSLSTAFEIGRLLALARPSAVAAMMQWRQSGYLTQRQRSIWDDQREFLDLLVDTAALDERYSDIGVHLLRGLASKIANRPGAFLGAPRPLVDPGRPLEFDDPRKVVAAGFGLDEAVLTGDLDVVLDGLRGTIEPGLDLAGELPVNVVRDSLHRVVDNRLVDLVSGTLDLGIVIAGIDDPGSVGGGVIGGGVVGGAGPIFVGPTVPGTIVGGVGSIGGVIGGVVDVGHIGGGGGPAPGTIGGIPFEERFRPPADDPEATKNSGEPEDTEGGHE